MPNSQETRNKFELAEDLEEIFALVFADPDEGGESGLRKVLSAADWVAREDLEDAALGLADAGMHKAARIVREIAVSHPSEDDLEEACPYESAVDIRAWHAAQPRRRARSRWWREEKRRRKRAGTW